MQRGEARLSWYVKGRAQSAGRRSSHASFHREPKQGCFVYFLRPSGCALRAPLSTLVLFLVVGCGTTPRAHVEKKLMKEAHSTSHGRSVAEQYLVGFPDVLEIQLPRQGQKETTSRFGVEPDGCIDLGNLGRIRIEGRTLPDIAGLIAERLGIDPGQVRVHVAEYRSKQVLLFGQVFGWQRSVPYQGQETVLDLLQRVGGITSGAEPRNVYVVRTHIAEGQRPEIFHVDLKAIVLKKDHKTNIRLQPFDQIYVGETPQFQLEKLIPPWLRPIVNTLTGKSVNKPQTPQASLRSPRYRAKIPSRP